MAKSILKVAPHPVGVLRGCGETILRYIDIGDHAKTLIVAEGLHQ